MINLLYQFDYDFAYSVNLRLFAHEIDFVVECFRNLENRVNQKTVAQHILLRAVKAEHFFAKLFFHSWWEIVE